MFPEINRQVEELHTKLGEEKMRLAISNYLASQQYYGLAIEVLKLELPQREGGE